MKQPSFRVYLLFLLTSLSMSGCNIFKGLDNPSSDEEAYSRAQALADNKDCVGAITYLEPIPSAERTDKARILLGWSYLCSAGASTKNVATSLYSYSSGSASLTAIGHLGGNLGSVTADTLATIDKATAVFGTIENPNIRNIEVAISKLVKASAILGYQATLSNESHLTKSNIADNTCDSVNSDCLVGCTVNSFGTMSDASVSDFTATMNEAVTILSSSSAADLSTLAAAIRNKVAGATNTARCFIYKEMIP